MALYPNIFSSGFHADYLESSRVLTDLNHAASGPLTSLGDGNGPKYVQTIDLMSISQNFPARSGQIPRDNLSDTTYGVIFTSASR
jgi:hypothetical protein